MRTLFGLSSLAVVGLGLLIGASGRAEADVVIGFDNLSSLDIVTNQYQSQGVTFTGAQVLTAGVSLSSAYPPHSGSNVVYDYSTGVITATTASGKTASMVGGYITSNTVITEYAYDAKGVLLGTSSTPGANYIGAGTGISPNFFLSVTAAGIASVQFHDTGNTFTLDDFTFSPTVTATPEPSTLVSAAMAGLVFAGYGLRLRRSKRTV